MNEENSIGDEVEPPGLSERQRDKISGVISRYLLNLSSVPDHKLFPVITAKLVEIFPTENEVCAKNFDFACSILQ